MKLKDGEMGNKRVNFIIQADARGKTEIEDVENVMYLGTLIDNKIDEVSEIKF